MCIAVLNTAGKLSKKTIQNCWESNSHGAGICHVENGKVVVFKELKDVNKLWKYYNSLRDKYDGNVMLHFRIATHGNIDEANCHPFKVSEEVAFIHNGIISQTSDSKSNYSDTWHFNEDILKSLPVGFLKNVAIRDLLSTYIDYSKLVFLDGENAYIINEHLGNWDGANWYSNQSYKDKTYDSRPKAKVGKDTYYKSRDYNDYSYVGSKGRAWYDEEQCECCASWIDVSYNADIEGYVCKNCIEEFQAYGDDRI
jgi:predicted glutamine amidotransferase